MLMSDNGFPRRIRTDLYSLPEKAIRSAHDVVEGAGADPLLTDAVILLSRAQEKVAEWIDREVDAGRMAMPGTDCTTSANYPCGNCSLCRKELATPSTTTET